jgi:hypothetical protein
MRTAILTTSVLLSLAACGSDEPEPARGTINSSSAESSIDSVHDVFAAMSTTNGAGAASAVMALTAAGQSVVTPTGQGGRMAPELAGMLPDRWPRSSTASLTGTAACDATSCTYTDFGDDTPYGSYRLNGTIRHAGDRLTFDLTYDISSSGFAFHWTMDGDLTVSDTLIDGYVRSHGETIDRDGNDYAISWDVNLDFDRIGLDGDRCPTSGTLTATVAYAVSGQNGGGNYAARGSVTFGPACGQGTLN